MSEVLAIGCTKGIITIINPKGRVELFRHPLLGSMSESEIDAEKSRKNIFFNVDKYLPFPNDYRIVDVDNVEFKSMSTYYK